jgi:hypothetical protein
VTRGPPGARSPPGGKGKNTVPTRAQTALGEKLAEVEAQAIATMNATKNDLEPFYLKDASRCAIRGTVCSNWGCSASVW